MNKIQCPKCHTIQKVDNARYCTECGTQLVTNEVIKKDRERNEERTGKKVFDINEMVDRVK